MDDTLRMKEYKGDALVKFLAVMIFNDYKAVGEVCSNHNLGLAAMKLELPPVYHPRRYESNTDERTKAFANAYEIRLWEEYEKEGIKGAMRFFKSSALETYMESQVV